MTNKPVINQAATAALLLGRLRDRLAPGQLAGDTMPAEDALTFAIDALQAAAQAQAGREDPPADPAGRKTWLQSLQNAIGNLQHSYRDSQAEFRAGLVAWEAARFFWYVVAGDVDTARAKLVLIEEAITYYKTYDKED